MRTGDSDGCDFVNEENLPNSKDINVEGRAVFSRDGKWSRECMGEWGEAVSLVVS